MPRYIITGALTPKLWTASKSKATKYRLRKVVTFADGSKIRMSAYGSTKAECVASFHAKAEAKAKTVVTADTMTFRDAAVRWLSDKKRSGCKYGTIYNYKELLNTHLLPPLGDVPLQGVTFQQLETILFNMTDRSKYRSAHLCRMIVDGIFKWARRYYRDSISLDNPVDYLQPLPKARKTPNNPKRAEKLWTSEQLKTFLQASKAQYDKRSTSYYPLYLLAVSAGLRKGELFGLHWENVSVDKKGQAYVEIVTQYVNYDKSFFETPKTEHGTRQVPITKTVYETLLKHRHIIATEYALRKDWQANTLVFPNKTGEPIKYSAVRTNLDRLIRKMGLPRITLHDFRKIYASNIANEVHQQGKFPVKIVQSLLGHASSDVAMEVYVKMLQDEDAPPMFEVVLDSEH